VVQGADASWAYNPDWAIVKAEDRKVYLVRETKASPDQMDLREAEWQKIQCGGKHFSVLPEVDFGWVQRADQV